MNDTCIDEIYLFLICAPRIKLRKIHFMRAPLIKFVKVSFMSVPRMKTELRKNGETCVHHSSQLRGEKMLIYIFLCVASHQEHECGNEWQTGAEPPAPAPPMHTSLKIFEWVVDCISPCARCIFGVCKTPLFRA